MSGVSIEGIVLDPAPVRLALPGGGRLDDGSIAWAAPHTVVAEYSYTAPGSAYKSDLIFWDATTGERRSKGFTTSFAGPFTSPDDNRVVVGDQTMQVFDASSGKKVASLKGHKKSRVQAVVRRAGYATGSHAMVKPPDQTLRFWGLDGSLEQTHKLGYT